MKLYKYQGAGNDFILFDARQLSETELKSISPRWIQGICDRHYGIGADGFIMLCAAKDNSASFVMQYFNSDGSTGMMCGNGGRCISAFADDLAIKNLCFKASDGLHRARILSKEELKKLKYDFLEQKNTSMEKMQLETTEELSKEKTKIISLSMKNLCIPKTKAERADLATSDFSQLSQNEYFIDTGTRHFVKIVKDEDIVNYDVYTLGKQIRNSKIFAPLGTNVNFVEPADNCLRVRTYEKGVEDETYACGTGIIASAIAVFLNTKGDLNAKPAYERRRTNNKTISYNIEAKRDRLIVEFALREDEAYYYFTDINLIGPTVKVCEITI